MKLPQLEIHLLGEFAIESEGRRLASPKAKKGQLLIALLALRPGMRVRRDVIAAQIWPDAEMESARFSLRQALASIRREAPELSPFIIATDHTEISLDARNIVVDVFEFERLVRQDPERAVSLYRGPLLNGIDAEPLLAFRLDAEERFVACLDSLAESADARQAVAYLRRASEIDPFREDLLQKLLGKLAECGDYSGLRMAYRRFAELVHSELNGAPSRDTQLLYRSLLEMRLGATPVRNASEPTSRIPVPTTALVGRESQIAEVCDLLGRCRLITLVGLGGVGKTRLSIAIGEQQLGNQRDGVWFVDLSSLTDPTRVASTVGKTLGLAEAAALGPEAIAQHIRFDERLLILDNCEHVSDAAAELVTVLMSSCKSVRIIATSRVPLGLGDEQRYSVPPMCLPEPSWDQPEGSEVDLPTYSGLALFQARARLVAPKFKVTSSNLALVASVCRNVDALPLGIEMAAARLGAMRLEDLSNRLGDKLAFLKGPARGGSTRHRSLNAVVEWSFDLLNPVDRAILCRLSVFAGGFTLDAAESVCGFGDIEPDCVLDALATLVEASLAHFDHGRYSLMETVRHFAGARLAQSGEDRETRNRHLSYFHGFVSSVENLVNSVGRDSAARRFGPEIDNVRSALNWALESNALEAGLDLVAHAAQVFSVLQMDREAVAWLQKLLANESAGHSSPDRILALRHACSLYQSQYADFDRATARERTIAACEELAALAEEVGDREALAEAYAQLGSVRLWWKADQARCDLLRSIRISKALPMGGKPQLALRLLGQSAYDARRFDKAEGYFRRSEAQAERAGDVPARVNALQAESHLLREHCRYSEALQRLESIERILRSYPDARAEAFNSLRIAELHLDRWDFASMAEPLAKAQEFFSASRGRLHTLLVDGLSRYLAASEHRYADAARGLSQAVESLISDAYGHPAACWHGACIEMEALSLCLGCLGEVADASRVLGAAQGLRERDWAFVSPSVRARWAHLKETFGPADFPEEVQQGKAMAPEEVVAHARRLEASLIARPDSTQ